MYTDFAMDDYDKIEEEAQKKLKPQKPKMKISGKSSFLLAKLSKEGRESPSTPEASNDAKAVQDRPKDREDSDE